MLTTAFVVVVVVIWAPTALGANAAPATAGSLANATSLSGADAVAISGSYAYVTAYNAGTLTVVDISNPVSPQVVGQTAFASSLLNGTNIAISGSYAYVVSKNRNGASGSNVNDDGSGNSLTIVDISNPTTPTIVGSLHDSVNLFGAYGVAVSGMYAYVAAQGCLTNQPCKNPNVGDDFAVVDVFDPSNPALVATIHNQSLPSPWTGSGALKHATSVALMGDYAFVTAAYTDRLTAIDVSDPAAPTIAGSIQDTSQLEFPVDVATSNGYAFVADQFQGLGRVAAVDVHDPTSMQIAGSLTNLSYLNGAYRIRVRNAFAYVAGTYASSMAAIDISDPTQLRLAGGVKNTVLLNRTTGLDVDAAGKYAVSVSPLLSTESSATFPPFPLQSGGPVNTGTVPVFTLDPVPVGVAITASSEPPSTTLQTTANFSFTLADAISTPRCSLDGSAFEVCSTPTTQTYNGLPPGFHTFTVEAVDAGGNTATASYSWTVTVPQPPANTTLPTISGQPVPRQLLFATQGSWTGTPAPTFTYQWEDCDPSGNDCTPIPGATSAEYTVTSADVGSTLDVVVSATNSAGTTPASSSPTAVVIAPSPLAPATPVLDGFDRANGAAGSNWSLIKSSGFAVMNVKNDAAVDSSASAFTWDYWNPSGFGPDSEAYATIANWGASDVIRIGARVVNAGTTTYSGYFVAISGTGVWSILRVDNGSTNPTTLITGPTQPLAAGDEIGIRIVGSVITALHYSPATNWTAVVSYDTSSNTTRYTGPGSLAIEFKTSTIDNFGGGTLTTAPTPPANQTAPTITGTATVGQTLTLNPGTWTGTPTPTLTVQWQDCNGSTCTPIPGATTSTYTITTTDTGFTINAVVTATNTAGQTSATSNTTAIVTAASSLAPTTPILDGFDRANGAAGINWSLIKPTGFAAMNISNGAAVDSSTTAFAWNYWNPSTFGPDSEAYATITNWGASDVIRIGARVTGVGTTNYSGYFVAISATGVWSILRIDNGGATTLATGPTQPLAAGDQIGIRIVGATITALHYTPTTNWTQVLTYNTSTDTTRYTGPGSLAIEFKTSTIDNFGGGSL
ncbi:MAG TPA: hypothetical protein VKR23_01625 [Gaiellaceae bacterium]|nr:hypothetical protein [Gaiellaceae bacterium]